MTGTPQPASPTGSIRHRSANASVSDSRAFAAAAPAWPTAAISAARACIIGPGLSQAWAVGWTPVSSRRRSARAASRMSAVIAPSGST